MATYTELFNLRSDAALRNRIAVACIVAAEAIRTENPATTDHAKRLTWAAAVFKDPEGEATRMLWAALAQNAGSPVAQITGASDATVQTAVNNAINVFAVG